MATPPRREKNKSPRPSSAGPKRATVQERPPDPPRHAHAAVGPAAALPADRRVQRTHAALRDALVSLVLQRGWDAVSVRDVCAHANVGRSTFYTHFADLEDLLLSGFAHLRRSLIAARALNTRERALRFSRPLLLHASDNRALFRALAGAHAGAAVQRAFRGLVYELVRDELPQKLARAEREQRALFVCGGFLEVVRAWLDGELVVDVDGLDALVDGFARPHTR